MAITVRAARPGDPASELLYESAASYYEAFAGGPARARSLLASIYPEGGHSASYEVCLIAEDEGAVAGVLAAFAAADAGPYARRFVSLSARRLPLPAWAGMIRHLRAAAKVSPTPPAGSWYVDALAVSPDHRRRGVARTLLAAAESDARRAGAPVLALDTGFENTAAQALYASAGFTERSESSAPDPATAAALGGRGFLSYVKRL
jgi:ribosomal protein S18 acetylase RimI-like enzyme